MFRAIGPKSCPGPPGGSPQWRGAAASAPGDGEASRPSPAALSVLRADASADVLAALRLAGPGAAGALGRELARFGAQLPPDGILPHAAFLSRIIDGLHFPPSEDWYAFLGLVLSRGSGSVSDGSGGGGVRFFPRPRIGACAASSSQGWAVRTSAQLSHVAQTVWPSSFHLINVAVALPMLCLDRDCLELGSGTGLAGLVLASLCPLRSLVLTDADDAALEQLHARCASHTSGLVDLSVARLPWGDLERAKDFRHATCLFGSDLAYDPRLHEALCGALEVLLAPSEAPLASEALHVPSEASANDIDNGVSHVIAFLSRTRRRFMLLSSTLRSRDTAARFRACLAHHSLRVFAIAPEAYSAVLDTVPPQAGGTCEVIVDVVVHVRTLLHSS